jgi:3-hydroxybutyryl-CoA dehydrogenase
MTITTVGIIGAGQMGSGIAQAASQHGYSVVLYDQSAERSEDARAAITGIWQRLVEKGRIQESVASASAARLSLAGTMEGLSDCELVIEAATENELVKQSIFQTLQPHLKPGAVLASNTSSLSITRLAAATALPERFIGIHFMNPVPVMKLVELIRGIQTDEATFEIAREFALSLGKTIAVAEDFPAFIVNRILIPMINEACYTLYEGVGTVESIDTAMKLGANHPMGPLELADFIGLDTCLAIMRVLHDELADTKYRPCPLMTKYVEAGWVGRKSGRGFYDYRGDKPAPTR